MLYSLSFNFYFFIVNNEGQNFVVEFSFSLYVYYLVVVQFDSNWGFRIVVDDCWEFVSGVQVVVCIFILFFMYFCVDSKYLNFFLIIFVIGDLVIGK